MKRGQCRTPILKGRAGGEMDKKELYMQYKKQVYADYPEVESFERRKERWLGFLILLGVTANVLKLIYAGKLMGGGSAGAIGIALGGIIGYTPELVILMAVMYPKWRLAIGLFFLGAYQLVVLGGTIRMAADSWDLFLLLYAEGARKYPIALLGDVLSVIKMLLFFATGVWLVAVRKNRELAEQSGILRNKLKAFQFMNRS